MLASEPRKGALLDRDAAEERVRELSERFGLARRPARDVEDIGVGQQQRVEILRVLHRGADVLILDEPTAVLTAQEIADLFKVLRALTAEGVSVIFISHKLREVLEIADRVTVLRRGKKIDTVPTRGRDRGEPRQADGRPRRAVPRREGARRKPGEPMLEVEDLEVEDDRGLPAVRGLSLQVRAGEIVGIAGRRRQRPVRAGRGDHRAARPERRPHPRRRPGHHRRRRARRARGGRRPHRRGPPPARPRSSTSRSPRTSRCASTGARR